MIAQFYNIKNTLLNFLEFLDTNRSIQIFKSKNRYWFGVNLCSEQLTSDVPTLICI